MLEATQKKDIQQKKKMKKNVLTVGIKQPKNVKDWLQAI